MPNVDAVASASMPMPSIVTITLSIYAKTDYKSKTFLPSILVCFYLILCVEMGLKMPSIGLYITIYSAEKLALLNIFSRASISDRLRWRQASTGCWRILALFFLSTTGPHSLGSMRTSLTPGMIKEY
jgi:hypothetical protein